MIPYDAHIRIPSNVCSLFCTIHTKTNERKIFINEDQLLSTKKVRDQIGRVTNVCIETDQVHHWRLLIFPFKTETATTSISSINLMSITHHHCWRCSINAHAFYKKQYIVLMWPFLLYDSILFSCFFFSCFFFASVQSAERRKHARKQITVAFVSRNDIYFLSVYAFNWNIRFDSGRTIFATYLHEMNEWMNGVAVYVVFVSK